MTPKEKAKELVNKFNLVNSKNYIDDNGLWDTEKYALIAVDEILKVLWFTHKNESEYRYWQEVKQEIEKL